MAVSDEAKAICAKYGHLFTNTGGNDPVGLLDDLDRSSNLAHTNIVVFTLAVSVSAQVGLIGRLIKEGLLT